MAVHRPPTPEWLPQLTLEADTWDLHQLIQERATLAGTQEQAIQALIIIQVAATVDPEDIIHKVALVS